MINVFCVSGDVAGVFSFVHYLHISRCTSFCSFFFQAEDGIRDLVRSRGLGDVYKRQALYFECHLIQIINGQIEFLSVRLAPDQGSYAIALSLIHI